MCVSTKCGMGPKLALRLSTFVSVQRILIIRFSSIGDIVLTSPVIRILRNRFPDADIRFVTKRQYRELVESNPYLSGQFYLKDSLNTLAKELKAFNPELVIDLHHNLRTRILRTIIGGTWRSFNKLNIEKWLMVNMKLDKLPDVHIVDRYLETLKGLGAENDNKGLDFFFPKEFVPSIIPNELKNGYVAVVVGAKFRTKQLPEHKLLALCKGINQPILLIGGNEDADLGHAIQQKCAANVMNGCGSYSLLQSAWFVQQAQVVVTHDTGMMHIAAAFNKKIISVWGNTVPAFGMTPYLPQGKAAFISEVNGLDCRPCGKIGFDACPKEHFNCMEQQDLEAIIQQIIKYIQS